MRPPAPSRNNIQEPHAAQKMNLKSACREMNICSNLQNTKAATRIVDDGSTCERRRFAQRAVLVVHIRGALLGAERRGGGQHQLLLNEAGFRMIFWELLEPLFQGAAEEVQTLGRLAQTTLGLRSTEEPGD